MKLKANIIGIILVILLATLGGSFSDTRAVAAVAGQGMEIGVLIIDGPPEPPAEYAAEHAASIVTSMDRASVVLTDFPAYTWVFGCSAVSGAMIAGYYDRRGYSNMYTGPTEGGVMPLTDAAWAGWPDPENPQYPNNPLVASHVGVDGQVGRGSIDDYWVSYGSSADDPYVTGSWTQHTWGTAIGDYMKTSQSDYSNVDGSTLFYYLLGNGKLGCDSMSANMAERDGTYGRKLFYEARGYVVTDCYYRQTDNRVSGGFSLVDYQAEIDAGHPVMLNLEGHTVVGFGYDGATIYIRDTWDTGMHEMTWGESYLGMAPLGVSVVNLVEKPAAFGKSRPGNGALAHPDSLTLTWAASAGATGYEYCYDTSNDNACSSWETRGLTTSVALSGLNPNTTYYWQVRAVNTQGETYADGGSTAFWHFTTIDPATLTERVYLPLLLR